MSVYTELKILGFQKIAFSQSLAVNGYHYELKNIGYGIYGQAPANGGILEIGFVEQNPVVLQNGEEEIVVEENCIFVIPPESTYSVRTLNEELHRHTSAEFLIRGQWKRVDGFSPPKGKTVTLPLVIPPSPGSSEIFSLIRSIACAKTTRSDRNYFEECADFMTLIHRLVALVQSSGVGSTISPGNRRYCDRAKAYISENIAKKLTVGDVALAVGVSKNYLTNIFSSSEGLPLIEFINRRKLSYMIELIRRYGYTLSQAGEHVGLTDVNYISRIFKRYYGMTLTEYKRNRFSSADSPIPGEEE
ncbi:MAG: helix-turn-helix transcriptional regulator [Clostridia bacterium]|nr:helix-turn-helix transcriptional regulator [Clostridia bacterium]